MTARKATMLDARCKLVLDAMDAAGRDGIAKVELVAALGGEHCAKKVFTHLKAAGIIDATTPKGGKPLWARVEIIDELRARTAAERAIQEKMGKAERNRRRESRALEETGYRRAHMADAPDMPVVQRVVRVELGSKLDIDPTNRPPRSVWEWKGPTLRRRAAGVAP
jgi:hypothetical protein